MSTFQFFPKLGPRGGVIKSQFFPKFKIVHITLGGGGQEYYGLFPNFGKFLIILFGLSQTISDYLGQSRTILDYLELSQTILHYLGLSWTISDYLGLSWTISDFLGLSWTIFRTILDYFLHFFGLSWTISDYLRLSLGLSSTFSDYLG